MIRQNRTLPYVSKHLPGGFANVEIVSVERSQVGTSEQPVCRMDAVVLK